MPKLPRLPGQPFFSPDLADTEFANTALASVDFIMTVPVLAGRLGAVGRFLGIVAILLSPHLPSSRAEQAVGLRDPLMQKLSQPMTSVVDGQPFREGLQRVADKARVNVCLFRGVDPSRRINTGPLGPTVFACLEQLAASSDCVVMPIANVVVIGPDTWVDHVTATVVALPDASARIADQIRWEHLSTPTEALRETLDSSPPLELPHDLWPAKQWQRIDRRVAISLVLAQFQTYPVWASRNQEDPPDAPPAFQLKRFQVRRYDRRAPSAVKLRYNPGPQRDRLIKAIKEVEPQSIARSAGEWVTVTASPAAHRAGVAALLQSQSTAGPDPDQDTFTLRRMSTSAANALAQLAQTAGRKLEIDPEAQTACQKIVDIEGQDVTLKQLIQMVATQAGVLVEWRSDELRITLPERGQPSPQAE